MELEAVKRAAVLAAAVESVEAFVAKLHPDRLIRLCREHSADPLYLPGSLLRPCLEGYVDAMRAELRALGVTLGAAGDAVS
jgi:hypothetical protein